MRLTGIITQGASRMGTAEFIKAFKVASGFDGKMYAAYKDAGQRKDKVCSINNVLHILPLFLWLNLILTSFLPSLDLYWEH